MKKQVVTVLPVGAAWQYGVRLQVGMSVAANAGLNPWRTITELNKADIECAAARLFVLLDKMKRLYRIGCRIALDHT